MKEQHWICGRTDEANILQSVVGWAVGSETALYHEDELRALGQLGYLTYRNHEAPGIRHRWLAYALTPLGLARLQKIDPEGAESATAAHQFYKRKRRTA